MISTLDSQRPIYLQIKEMIEEDILNGKLKPDEQIPSNSQLVSYYNINPVTVLKGINLLVDDGIIYKKRGIGMYVTKDAPTILRKRFSKTFVEEQIEPLINLAKPLEFSRQDVIEMVKEAWEVEKDD